jgi:hypothetical protein
MLRGGSGATLGVRGATEEPGSLVASPTVHLGKPMSSAPAPFPTWGLQEAVILSKCGQNIQVVVTRPRGPGGGQSHLDHLIKKAEKPRCAPPDSTCSAFPNLL